MNYEKIRFKVYYHYENVPDWIKRLVMKKFMNRRNRAVRVLNESGIYQKINEKWDLEISEKPMLGSYIEDINPRYAAFVNERVQPILDEKVNKGKIFRIISGRYCDLEMTIIGIKNSRVWIDLEEIK